MNDHDLGGNRTVFRPSPLAALKSGGSSVIAPPAPPRPVSVAPPPVAVAPVAPPSRASRSGVHIALLAVFVAIAVLAIGYVALQLTGTVSAPTPMGKTGHVDRAAGSLGHLPRSAAT